MMQASGPVDGDVIVLLYEFLCAMNRGTRINLAELVHTRKDRRILLYIEVLLLSFSDLLWLGVLQEVYVLVGVKLLQHICCGSVWPLSQHMLSLVSKSS